MIQILFSMLFVVCPLLAKAQVLEISNGTMKKTFTRDVLLKRGDMQKVVAKKDPAYPGKTMTYKAVPVANLFKGLSVQPDAVIQFRALDGFSAPLSTARLLNTDAKQSVAFVAVEDPAKPWPALGKGKGSAGPFYLIWKNPELSLIGTEEWPFMLAALEVKGTLESMYPAMLPEAKFAENSDVKKGFRLFVKNCFACHTLNKAGSSHMGPDLNVPMSPTEYLQPAALTKLIRNPQSLRHWPESKMKGFSKDEISDADVQRIVSYLRHMATSR